MSICPACSASAPAEALFCPTCGSRLNASSAAEWEETRFVADEAAARRAPNVVSWPSAGRGGGTGSAPASAVPYARRLWPDALVGWTRLLAGHIYDPRVGRDVLIGCVIGACLCLAELGRALVPSLLGRPAPYPSFGGRVSLLLGGGHVVGQLTDITYGPLLRE